MDFSQAFLYPFNDPDWLKKILLIGVVSLIPIIGQLVAVGWMLEIIRRTIRHDPVLLPDLDFSPQLTLGFKGAVAGLVYALPVFIVMIPYFLIAFSVDSNNAQATNAVMGITSLCFTGLMLVYSLVLAVMLPAALANLVVKDRIGAAFEFRMIFRLLQAAPLAYLMAIVGTMVASFAAGIGIIACVIGLIFTNVYYYAVSGNLYGQAYNEATRNESLNPAVL